MAIFHSRPSRQRLRTRGVDTHSSDYIRISLELIYSLFTDEVEAGECVLNEVTSVDTVLGPGSSVSPEISDVGKASSGEVLDLAVEKTI